MSASAGSDEDKLFLRRAVEASIRIGLLVLLLAWCTSIIRPFLGPVVWGIIIAIAGYPAYQKLRAATGGRDRLAAGLFAGAGLLLLFVPAAMLSGTLADTAQVVSGQLQAGTLVIPPPPEKVATWPLIGQQTYELWSLAASNLEAALHQMSPQLKLAGAWLLSTVAGAGLALLQFVLAIVIAAALLAHDVGATQVARAIAVRVAGDRGHEFVVLTGSTISSVATGVLGVALIQSVLAGLGMALAGVPGAGLWALLVLILAVVQLPGLLILGPVAVYVFSVSSTTVAVLFLIWSVAVSMSDTFLKPIFLGRGVDVPMLVIFVGAIGGMMAEGIIGLFVGAVVLTVSYKLFLAWLGDTPLPAAGGDDVP